MKTAHDPRHIRRQKAVKGLFSFSFKKQKSKNQLAQKIFKNKKKIDQVITRAAPEWPIEQINRVDLAILRLAVYELTIEAKEPPKVIIDEAVELGKRYGSEKSPGFVNGVLGTVYKLLQPKGGRGLRQGSRKPASRSPNPNSKTKKKKDEIKKT